MGFYDRIENLLGSHEETIRSISKDIEFKGTEDNEVLEWGDEVEIEQDEITSSSTKDGLLSKFSKKTNEVNNNSDQEDTAPEEPPKISSFPTWADDSEVSQGVAMNEDTSESIDNNVDTDVAAEENQAFPTENDAVQPDDDHNVSNEPVIVEEAKTSTPFIIPDREPLSTSTQVFNYINVRDYPDAETILSVKDVESVTFKRDAPVGYNLSQVDLFTQGVKSSLLSAREETEHHEHVIAALVSHIINTDHEKIEIEKVIVEREQELKNALQSGTTIADRNNELYKELSDAKRRISELEEQNTATTESGQASVSYATPTAFDQSDDEIEDQLLSFPELNQGEENR